MPNTSFHSSITEPKPKWLEVILLWVAGIAAAMQFAKFSVSFV